MHLFEKFGSKTIGEMLAEHPRIGEILTKHRIDCVACGSGSCLFKNVVATHTYDPTTASSIQQEIQDYLTGMTS